jgi:hypothetical protein
VCARLGAGNRALTVSNTLWTQTADFLSVRSGGTYSDHRALKGLHCVKICERVPSLVQRNKKRRVLRADVRASKPASALTVAASIDATRVQDGSCGGKSSPYFVAR